MRYCGKQISKRGLRKTLESSSKYFVDKFKEKIKLKESMNKTKNKVIAVPTTQKVKEPKIKFAGKLVKKTPLLKKPRSARSKENTLAYFDCMKDQVKNYDGVKITAMCHQCKHNKGKVLAAKKEEKQLLVNAVVKNYVEFGKSLGNLLCADVVKGDCSCKK